MKNLILKEAYHPGIYLITCTTNNKTYIGSSKCIYHRVKRHLSDLRKNKHANPIIQNCFNKYGEDGFVTTILEQLPNQDNTDLLIEKEIFWIDKLKPCMNINEPIVISLTDSQKAQISESLRVYFKDNPQKGKKLTIFDLEGNVIGHFDRWSDAAKHCNTLRTSLSKVLDKSLRFHNYLVRSGHITENPIPYIRKNVAKNLRVSITIPDLGIIETKYKKEKVVLQFSNEGIFMNYFLNSHLASEATGVGLSAIYGSIKTGGRGSGYYWKYYKQTK